MVNLCLNSLMAFQPIGFKRQPAPLRFGFSDASSILINKLLQMTLSVGLCNCALIGRHDLNHNTMVYQYRSCTQFRCIVPAHYAHSVIQRRPIRASCGALALGHEPRRMCVAHGEGEHGAAIRDPAGARVGDPQRRGRDQVPAGPVPPPGRRPHHRRRDRAPRLPQGHAPPRQRHPDGVQKAGLRNRLL